MIDSGCSTFLLPLTQETLNELEKLYIFPEYIWRIGGTKGFGALSSPTLAIRSGLNKPFEAILLKDVRPFKICLPYLRFHISFTLAKVLSKKRWLFGKKKLKNHIKGMSKISKIFNTESFDCLGGEREFALIGQTFLSPYDMLQKFNVVAILDPKFFETNCDTIVEMGKLRGLAGLCEDFYFPEGIDGLEDIDHDQDDNEFTNSDSDI